MKIFFAKVHFPERYPRIDCSDDFDFVNFTLSNPSLSKVLEYLQINYGFVPDGNQLLIVDEAQECLPIISLMKQFCEKKSEIPLIVTGSMVRIKILRDTHKRGVSKETRFLFPVGKINQLYMYPMTFDEFVLNYNASLYSYLKDNYTKKQPLDPVMHKKVLGFFNDYLFVGGMPEAVNGFLAEKENRTSAFKRVASIIKDIYDNYLADMDLYQASPESIIRSRAVFRDIYKQLNKENKNFKYSLTEENAKGRDMMNPIAWLVEARIVNQSFQLKEKVTLPLVKEEDSLMRLYPADMGLFTYQSGLSAREFITDSANALSGIFYENYVSMELAARGKGLFYWKGERNCEFEFLLGINGQIVPLDVKKGRRTLNSLSEIPCRSSEITTNVGWLLKFLLGNMASILNRIFYLFLSIISLSSWTK